MKSQKVSEMESKDLIESAIDLVEIFKNHVLRKNDAGIDQIIVGNDQIDSPLFSDSDKEFLNEDWHNYTCTESCAAIGNARHGCKSLGTDIQSIRELMTQVVHFYLKMVTC